MDIAAARADIKEQKADQQETLRIMRGIKASAFWPGFQERFLEARIKGFQLEAMKPCDTQQQMMAAERAKGAFIALQGLLQAFSVPIPPDTSEDSDDVS